MVFIKMTFARVKAVGKENLVLAKRGVLTCTCEHKKEEIEYIKEIQNLMASEGTVSQDRTTLSDDTKGKKKGE